MRDVTFRSLRVRSGTVVGMLIVIAAAAGGTGTFEPGLLTSTLQQDALVEWPQEVTVAEGTIVIYQPQPEHLSGNILSGRAAMALEITGRDEPVFGAFWFDARLSSGTDGDKLFVRDLTVTRVSWPDATEAQQERFTAIVGSNLPETGLEISRDRLSASLATADAERASLDQIKNDAPAIVFRDRLAVLLIYDGEPRFSPVDNSDYQRALNTPFLVVRDGDAGPVYLSSGVLWYRAADAMGPWSTTSNPPADLVALVPAPEPGEQAPSPPPEIVVASEPTELIVSDGDPRFQVLPDGDLMYVENTETPWIRQLSTNQMYVLLSGRWFRSSSQDGPWEFVRADRLPAGFKDIPPASDIGGVRTSVAGTDEADEALLDAQIPEMSAIKRDEASLDVEYDGTPDFEAIPGTSVSYAVNTGAQVLEIHDRYYAADHGVWFTSASATGPWEVADDVPEDEIAKIPASSPVYNVTHVHVYESTPEVVYVGYTPGYMWSFPYYGVPVYGTGWYYPPYYGAYYYPRPVTWGMHVGYNPWTGWTVGVGWSVGFFTFGVAWVGGWGGAYHPGGCCGGWHGGGYNRPPVYINNGDINIGNNVNVGNRVETRDRVNNSARTGANGGGSPSLYDRPDTRSRNADAATARNDLQRARPSTGRENNVYADRNGTVARRSNDGWQTREGGAWGQTQSANQGAARPQNRPSADFGGLNQAHSARQSGANRASSRGSGGGRRGRPFDDGEGGDR
jgi:hypothetical protein